MATYKYIYLRKDMPVKGMKPGHMFANVHYLEGYNPARIKDIQRMAKAMKKDVREVKIDQVECNHVTKSSYCQGFTLTRWDGVIFASSIALHDLEEAGWHIVKEVGCEYFWA